jgi:hypothetical protein
MMRFIGIIDKALGYVYANDNGIFYYYHCGAFVYAADLNE